MLHSVQTAEEEVASAKLAAVEMLRVALHVFLRRVPFYIWMRCSRSCLKQASAVQGQVDLGLAARTGDLQQSTDVAIENLNRQLERYNKPSELFPFSLEHPRGAYNPAATLCGERQRLWLSNMTLE